MYTCPFVHIILNRLLPKLLVRACYAFCYPMDRCVQVSDETMKSRIMHRGETSGRSDDNEATVMKRIDTFHANNQPVVDFYKKRKKLCAVLFFLCSLFIR